MIETLKNIDHQLFFFINGKHNVFFDALMKSISDPRVAFPLYLFVIYLFIVLYKKKSWFYVLALFAVVGFADFASVQFFKEVFMRFRPCHEPDFMYNVHLVNSHCGGKFGFVSSHATNNFALATIFGLLNYKNFRFFTYVLFFWAIIVSYSRVYLGVHYPGDVLGGAILGATVAYVGYIVIKYLEKKVRFLAP
jgi:undecaprenyl-diphosphatase